MKIIETAISGVAVVETEFRSDQRGAFGRLFCQNELKDLLEERTIVQINQSRTTEAGTVRGLHFQYPPHAEMKMVRCLKGKVFDVAVDLRKGSPTFLQWHAEEISSDNGKMMVVPEGCAHGFQVLEPDSELLYLHTEFYTPESEGGVPYDDPELAIAWPLPVIGLSERDQKHPKINSRFTGITL